MTSFDQLVERVRADLMGPASDQVCTFTDWMLDGSDKVGVKLADMPADQATRFLLELGPELVFVSSYEPQTGNTSCPSWFRQRQGSPANDSFPPGSMAIIDPRWSYWTIWQKLVAGVNACYPNLFAVKNVEFESEPYGERYLMPSDCESIADIRLVYPGPGNHERPIQRSTLDVSNVDGNRYLFIPEVGIGGQTIRVTYRTRPVLPAPTAGSADFTTTGLPESAADLPELYAKAALMPTPDASRTQTSSIEQSERNKYVQAGSGSSLARLWMQMFSDRLQQERQKLEVLYPLRTSHRLNG
ncbi:hypothetical protein [Lentzea sp. NBRC 102530]|uniref:hypothetical protein n=1 Tax=Lentzea sp. NBRC 102530 TaxID=3032201 RepID=UPI0024A13FB4|nr:hypothetical protein [Lentzea sp. NBRC 102530]GLY55332.1 hypothetical protein Lesp01_89870 [Lentzea sp. NBRC 102530]